VKKLLTIATLCALFISLNLNFTNAQNSTGAYYVEAVKFAKYMHKGVQYRRDSTTNRTILRFESGASDTVTINVFDYDTSGVLLKEDPLVIVAREKEDYYTCDCETLNFEEFRDILQKVLDRLDGVITMPISAEFDTDINDAIYFVGENEPISENLAKDIYSEVKNISAEVFEEYLHNKFESLEKQGKSKNIAFKMISSNLTGEITNFAMVKTYNGMVIRSYTFLETGVVVDPPLKLED